MDYSRKLESILAAFSGKAPKILLHSCCAVCSSHVLDYLSPFFDIDVLYFNPNIYPATEYQKRKAEQQRLIRETVYPNPVRYLDGDYDYDLFLSASAGLENAPEGGERCRQCFALRLGHTARYAAQAGGYDYIATTLTISPHKNAIDVNTAGERAAIQNGLYWLPGDFKKKNGFQRANQLAKEKNLYRQDYCGCQFSLERKIS